MIRHDTVTEQFYFVYHSEFNFIFNDIGYFNIGKKMLFVMSANCYVINISAFVVIKIFKSDILSIMFRFIVHYHDLFSILQEAAIPSKLQVSNHVGSVSLNGLCYNTHLVCQFLHNTSFDKLIIYKSHTLNMYAGKARLGNGPYMIYSILKKI